MWRAVLIAAGVFLAGSNSAHSSFLASADNCCRALVIGNDAYDYAPPLNTAGNDATDVGDALERNGFEVIRVLNADHETLRRSLNEFASDPGTVEAVRVVFYAGHGTSVYGRGYLIPVDASINGELDVPFQAVSLDLAVMATKSRSGFGLLILDALFIEINSIIQAGEDPSPTSEGEPETISGLAIAYASQPGTHVFEGEGRNSVFTTALLEQLEQTGMEFGVMFRKVRDAVVNSTNGTQRPYLQGSLPGRAIYLAPPPDSARHLAPLPESEGRGER